MSIKRALLARAEGLLDYGLLHLDDTPVMELVNTWQRKLDKIIAKIVLTREVSADLRQFNDFLHQKDGPFARIALLSELKTLPRAPNAELIYVIYRMLHRFVGDDYSVRTVDHDRSWRSAFPTSVRSASVDLVTVYGDQLEKLRQRLGTLRERDTHYLLVIRQVDQLQYPLLDRECRMEVYKSLQIELYWPSSMKAALAVRDDGMLTRAQADGRTLADILQVDDHRPIIYEPSIRLDGWRMSDVTSRPVSLLNHALHIWQRPDWVPIGCTIGRLTAGEMVGHAWMGGLQTGLQTERDLVRYAIPGDCSPRLLLGLLFSACDSLRVTPGDRDSISLALTRPATGYQEPEDSENVVQLYTNSRWLLDGLLTREEDHYTLDLHAYRRLAQLASRMDGRLAQLLDSDQAKEPLCTPAFVLLLRLLLDRNVDDQAAIRNSLLDEQLAELPWVSWERYLETGVMLVNLPDMPVDVRASSLHLLTGHIERRNVERLVVQDVDQHVHFGVRASTGLYTLLHGVERTVLRNWYYLVKQPRIDTATRRTRLESPIFQAMLQARTSSPLVDDMDVFLRGPDFVSPSKRGVPIVAVSPTISYMYLNTHAFAQVVHLSDEPSTQPIVSMDGQPTASNSAYIARMQFGLQTFPVEAGTVCPIDREPITSGLACRCPNCRNYYRRIEQDLQLCPMCRSTRAPELGNVLDGTWTPLVYHVPLLDWLTGQRQMYETHVTIQPYVESGVQLPPLEEEDEGIEF